MKANEKHLETLRYPIGRATFKPELTARDRNELIDRIAQLPARLQDAVAGMSEAALDTPYRPGGWTARQVIHHLPDSHVNAYVRFKLALTETEPTIKTYAEAEWARLADSAGPIQVSLDLLTALHARWTAWMRTLDEAAWRRAYVHPESGRTPLERTLQLYAWHGEHHLAHVRGVRERAGNGKAG
jgi:hypothetical protein